MKKKQKFQRGNLVEVLVGHQIYDSRKGIIDISPEDVGRQAIIEYSYNDEYGGGDTDSYSIMFCDDGNTVAWKSTEELKFINKGGNHLFKLAKANRKKISKRNTDITYIAKNIDKGNLNSESILYLFSLLGHDTSFLRNGEYFTLFYDWNYLHPYFCHIKNAMNIEDAKSIFSSQELCNYDIQRVYNAFHPIT